MKRAFSLVELLVVIGIICVLAGIMIASFSGSTESARAAQCLSNMRNLAAACQTYGSVNGRYPFAGSIEYMKIDEEEGIRRAKSSFHEVPGWISWASKGAYARKVNSHVASAAWMTSCYSTDTEESFYCLTNGALWRYVSGSQQTYVCPEHVRKHRKNPPHWSYVMNAYFGWDTSKGGAYQGENFNHVRYGDRDKAYRTDRILLFGELQFMSCGLTIPDGTGSGTECDCVLQYNTSSVRKDKGKGNGANAEEGSGNEFIGVNHRNGRNLHAHVAFADGHVEKLNIPYSGPVKKPEVDESMLRNLTTWLCTGEDVSFDGKRYQRMEN